MSRYLRRHPAAQFIAPTGACNAVSRDGAGGRQYAGVDTKLGQVITLRKDNAEVDALSLVHVRNPGVENRAYIVHSNGYTIVHVGDAQLAYNEEYLRKIDWGSHAVDLLFVQYVDYTSDTREIIEKLIKPKHVVLMHIPEG